MALRMVKRSEPYPDDVTWIEREIASADERHAAAVRERDRLQALPAPESFEASRSRSDEIERAAWDAGKATADRVALERRLVAAKQTAAAAARQRHADRYGRLKAVLATAAELQAEAIALDQAARAEVGESWAATHLPSLVFRGLLLPEFVQHWTKFNDESAIAAHLHARQTADATLVPVPRVVPERSAAPRRMESAHFSPRVGASGPAGAHAQPTISNQGVRLDQPPQAAPQRSRNPDDMTPLAAGEVRARVLRPGYEGPTGQCDGGQTIRLDAAVARKAAERGALQIIEESPVPAPVMGHAVPQTGDAA